MNKYKLYTDCVNFPLDRPCKYQKDKNAVCGVCKKYVSVNKKSDAVKILIIKLGAMGDVLRTTFILEGLKQKYKKTKIDWLVDSKNAAVLEGNKYIDNIVCNDGGVFNFLTSAKYNIVINLDLSPESLSFAALAFADKRIGYWLDNSRIIQSSNSYAGQWLLTSAYDTLKKANTETYQFWMAKILELPKDDYEIIVPISKQAKQKAVNFMVSKKIKAGKIIGINPGAGKRWVMKKWNSEKYIELIKVLSAKGYTILLLGGKDDEDEIKQIVSAKIKNVYSTGTDNSVQEFFAMVDLCDLVVCGDTMAMHAALGLKKNVVAIFGPTSSNEIEMYSRGSKIVALDCNCCYRQLCTKKVTCMDKVLVENVLDAVESYIY
ncbi:MAG: glycosyltransferase family 9 protein [Endomicrobiaceae bacterium]|jgi:heptosyltransferase-2|nr:glycosyltransferase family 9 protein [Endomicrobiaceae bacterium]